MLANVFRVGLSFSATVISIRLMGLEGFGVISGIVAHVLVAHYIGTLGLDQSFAKPEALNIARSVVVVGLGISLTLGAITVCVIYLLADIAEAFPSVFLLLAAQAILTGVGGIMSGYLRLTQQYSLMIWKDQVLLPVSTLISALAVLVTSDSILAYAATYFTLTLFIVSYVTFRVSLSLPAVGEERVHVMPALMMLWRSLPVAVMTAVESFGPAVLLILATHVVSYDEVGLLATAIRFAALTGLFSLALSPILGGRIAAAGSVRAKEAEDLVKKYALVSAAGAIAVYMFMVAFGAEITRALRIGGDQVGGLWIVVFLAFLIDSVSSVFKVVLISSGEAALLSKIQILGFLTTGITAGLLGDALGLPGLAIGLTVGFLVVTVGRLRRVSVVLPGCVAWIARQGVILWGLCFGALLSLAVVFGFALWVRTVLFLLGVFAVGYGTFRLWGVKSDDRHASH